MKKLFLLINAFLLVGVLVSACKAPPPAPLENTKWELLSYGGPGPLKSVIKGPLGTNVITAVFDASKGTVAGTSGINYYGGKYTIDGDNLTIKDITVTLMAGPQPLMDQEQEYLNLLGSAETYRISGGELRIHSAGEQVLRFIQKK